MWSFGAWLAVVAFQLIRPKWQKCSISFNVFYSLMNAVSRGNKGSDLLYFTYNV